MSASPALVPPRARDGSTVVMRRLDPARELPAICELFTEVFQQPMPEDYWRWKYLEAPGSSHYHVVAAHATTGRLLGHMGVLIQPGVRGRQAVRMAHAADLMISSLGRAGIGPDSIYRHIMHHVRQEACAEPSAEGSPLFMYGFPGLRPGTLAVRLGIQRRLQVCTQYTWPARVDGASWFGRWRKFFSQDTQAVAQPASEAAWADAVLDPIWQRRAEELLAHAQKDPAKAPPAIVKNGAYLRWRYLRHPHQVAAQSRGEALYTLWLVQPRGRGPSGWIVTRLSPQPTVVDSCLPGGLSAGLAAMQALPSPQALGGSCGQWVSWLPHPHSQGQETPIWATAMVGSQFHDDWPGPAFQPGDTDVF